MLWPRSTQTSTRIFNSTLLGLCVCLKLVIAKSPSPSLSLKSSYWICQTSRKALFSSNLQVLESLRLSTRTSRQWSRTTISTQPNTRNSTSSNMDTSTRNRRPRNLAFTVFSAKITSLEWMSASKSIQGTEISRRSRTLILKKSQKMALKRTKICYLRAMETSTNQPRMWPRTSLSTTDKRT